MHSKWARLLREMGAGTPGSGVSAEMLGKVLFRAAIGPEPAPRSEISKGSMLARGAPVLASGSVGKAVDALIASGLLSELQKSRGQVGAPVRPLALGSERWAIVGIHVDHQHDGPDKLTGVICGLNRKTLSRAEEVSVEQQDGQHDLRALAQAIRQLTHALLEQAASQDGRTAPQLLGVGVELGGHVHHGRVIDSTHARWSQPVDLGEALTNELKQDPQLHGIPVIVENDVNAFGIHGFYEQSFKGRDIALVAVFQRGVGGALILDGRIYRGARGMAPEPGHLAVEYPKNPGGSQNRLPGWSAGMGRTFDDECMCSTSSIKMYGHVDTLATPSRIEGQLAALMPDQDTSLEKAATVPRAVFSDDQDRLVVSEEAKILHRAGRGLGRGLAHIINIVNPGQLVLLLPEPLALPAPQSSGTEYLEAAEREIDNAYSTGPTDARGGEDQLRLTVHSYVDNWIARDGAIAAATTAFHAFTEHARGYDGCPPPDSKETPPASRQEFSRRERRPARDSG
jgi:predicted NBD/HSP70 family sugar kinase